MIIYDWMGHLVSTESAEELHAFAKKLGLKRKWYQEPAVNKKTGAIAIMGRDSNAHYDLTTERMKMKARQLGALEFHPHILVKIHWAARDESTYNVHEALDGSVICTHCNCEIYYCNCGCRSDSEE